MFSLDLALRCVLTLAEKLRRGVVEVRHIFGDDEPGSQPVEGAERKENKRADDFLKQVSELKRLAGERDKLVAEADRAMTSRARRARIEKRLAAVAQAVGEVLLEPRIGGKHVQILVDKLKVDGSKVQMAASLYDELGLDSIDLMTAVMAMEERFGIEISDNELEQVTTVGDAVHLLSQKVAANA